MVGAAASLGGVTRMTGMLQCSPFYNAMFGFIGMDCVICEFCHIILLYRDNFTKELIEKDPGQFLMIPL